MAKNSFRSILMTSTSQISFIVWIGSIAIAYLSLYIGVRSEWADTEAIYLLASVVVGTISYLKWSSWIIRNYISERARRKKYRSYQLGAVVVGCMLAYVLAQGTWLLPTERYVPPQELLKEDNQTCDEQQTLQMTKNCTVLINRSDGGHGTGFSIDGEHIVTNRHVIEGAVELSTFLDGNETVLSVWNYSDPEDDIAVLKSPVTLHACPWGDSEQIKLAASLYVVGWPNYPYGESTISKGIYSKLTKSEQGPEFIQTDAAVNPGNSGGPLINNCGVVGIVTSKTLLIPGIDLLFAEGQGNAISSNYARPIVNELITSGSTRIPPNATREEIEYTPENSYGDEYANSGYTQDVIDSWVRARTTTRNMKQKWDSATGSYDSTKLSKLKDLLARMSAVVETIVPKIMGQETLSSEENRLLQEWKSMYSQAASLESELNKSNQSKSDYSFSKYHYTCQDMSCKRVEGEGANNCFIDSECYHLTCEGRSCKKVAGKGENQCYHEGDSYSCTHSICQNNQCVEVDGPGSNECYSDYGCQ